jgi:putative phosphoribosyl transferase
MKPTQWSEDVRIPIGDVALPGELSIPADPRGVILFAHGSGSSRKSPRNRAVAEALHDGRFATLLFDLLSESEDHGPEARFDIELLTARLLKARHWVAGRPDLEGLRMGFFGASTGAAAALRAAATEPFGVGAVVVRGGRPDLAFDALEQVDVPTLLIVGGGDPEIVDLNLSALERLRCEKRMAIVPGAGHLFDEAGALERVAGLARRWFESHLCDHGNGGQGDASPTRRSNAG